MIFRSKEIKNLLFGLSILLMISCNKSKSFIKEIEYLKRENDSLTKTLNEINNKYIFDSIFLKTVPSPKNSFKLNSDYEMDIILVAYDANSNYFIGYDSIVGKKRINPDTLKHKNGTFKFKTILNENIKPISINVNVNNKYGKKIKGKLSDIIRTE